MTTTKPHNEWREIGLPWLARVPAHWEVQRGKTLFDAIDVRSKTGAEELLTVSANHGVIPRNSANVTMFQAETYDGYKLCWPDDLVINSLWAWSKGLAVSNYHGIISSAYGVYRTRNRLQYHPRFVNYLARSTPFQWELQIRSKGIWISRLQLTDEAFLAIPFPVPPPEEQAAIVRFLDHADEQIQRYIAGKERLIALLEEERQALVHQAVTRGLDPNVRLKPSGMEWLGNVPEHWEVTALKRIGSFKSGAGFPISHQGSKDSELPFFKVSDMNISGNERTMKTWNNAVTHGTAEELGAFIFPAGSIIFPKVGGALLTNKRRVTEQPCCIDNNIMGCVIQRGDPNFVLLLLEQIDLGNISKPGPVPAISEGEVREIRTVFPPTGEQSGIVEHLSPHFPYG